MRRRSKSKNPPFLSTPGDKSRIFGKKEYISCKTFENRWSRSFSIQITAVTSAQMGMGNIAKRELAYQMLA